MPSRYRCNDPTCVQCTRPAWKNQAIALVPPLVVIVAAILALRSLLPR